MQIRKLMTKDNFCGYGHPMEVPHAPKDKTKIVDNSDITRKGDELLIGSREYTGWSVTCPVCREMWQKKGVEGQMLDLYGVWFFWESFGPIKVRRTIAIKRDDE